jgi:RNA-directed DNA polymerase
MRDPFSELGQLRKLAKADPTKRFDALYRLICHPALLAVAAERVPQNTGGRTAGIDGQTRKQITSELLAQLADQLTQHQYRPQAVRRAYIPKGKTGKRALGIPAIRDRMVQAAVAQVLEPIYEPIFRNCSYGFRPHRNPMQALRQVAQASASRSHLGDRRGSGKVF